MRGVFSLAILMIVPLASGILVGIEPPTSMEETLGREVVIRSEDVQWNQEMWNDLENEGLFPLRLLNPNELNTWAQGDSDLIIEGMIIEEGFSAEWRSSTLNKNTYNGEVWVVFEPNLPSIAANFLIDNFKQSGVSISGDLSAYASVIPHRELIDLDSSLIKMNELLNLNGVLWVEPKLESSSRNVLASSLMGDGSISQPTQWSLGLNGTGVVLGIADSGIDYDHACFRNATSAGEYGSDGINGDYGIGDFGSGHRKIILLNESIDSHDTIGHINFRHGTHTAGSLACFNVYDYRNDMIPSNASAMSHNAQIIVQDIVSSEGWLPPDNVSELLSESALLGGVIHSNSWGDDTTEYTARSAEFDAWSTQMPWSLAFIAPGNTGGALLEPANARNVIAIGASTKEESANLWPSSSIGPTELGTYGIFALAPGVSIQSAKADGISNSYNDDLRSSSGTSMSTPTAASFAGVIQQMVQDGWLLGANENTTFVNISQISPNWANLDGNSISLGDGFVPSGPLIKSLLAISTTQIISDEDYSKRNNDVGFGVLNLSELIDVDSILTEIEFNDISPSEDVWIHDSFRLEEKTPSQWLDERTDGGDVLDDLTSLPWDGSGAVGPFLANGQNWTKRLVPNGEDIRITMSFPSSPEPYLVEDLQLVARTSTGFVTVGDYYDGDGFSAWFDGSVSLDDDTLFNSNNETTVEIKFSSIDLIDVEWIDVEVRARYISPGNNPGYTGVGGDRVGFALAAKGVVRDSMNWEDSDGDGLANVEDSCPNEDPIQWDVDEDGCIDDTDMDGVKDNIDLCIEQDSTGYDTNQDGCIDDNDMDGVGDNLDLCETPILDSNFPVDNLGCRPIDNPPKINQVIISGIDNFVWADSVSVSWSIEDLDRDFFETGARIMLHQNSTESSFFPIASCNYDSVTEESNEFLCIWNIPDDLPIFDITEKEMHIQIHVKSLNLSPEANIYPLYFDDNMVFTSKWINPLFEDDENKGMKDEDWNVTQRRALVWGIVGLIGVGIFMLRIWSSNNDVLNDKSGEIKRNFFGSFDNHADLGESE